jgi:hypothetical protein
MLAHELTPIQRAERVMQMQELGNQQLSQLLAAMLEWCPCGEEQPLFFITSFLRWLPNKLPPVTHNMEHFIKTTGRPVMGKYCSLNLDHLAAAKAEFAALENQGRSSSSWTLPLHMVKKPDGMWRTCGDFLGG